MIHCGVLRLYHNPRTYPVAHRPSDQVSPPPGWLVVLAWKIFLRSPKAGAGPSPRGGGGMGLFRDVGVWESRAFNRPPISNRLETPIRLPDD
jgi:hypothetical protein